MPQVFISYRREDTSGHVGRLQEGLRKELGSKNVFIDVDSIQPGVDFERAIRAAVSRSDYVLVVIGKDWLVTTNPQGQRRLDDPHDYVRLELIYALESEARIVPILVKGAQMPREEELPEPLRILSKQQCVELRDARWNADFMDLIAHLGGSPSLAVDAEELTYKRFINIFADACRNLSHRSFLVRAHLARNGRRERNLVD